MQQLYDYLFGCNKLRKPNFNTTLEEFCDNNNIDIDNINEQQLNVFYYHKHNYSEIANAKETYLANIVETLTSHSGKKLALRLQKIIGEHGEVCFYETDKPHTIVIYLTDRYLLQHNSYMDFCLSDTKESNSIYRELQFFNYHITEISKSNNSDFIIIEPKYSEDVTNKLRSKTDVFYHITSKSNINKILKRGLTPKVGKTRIQGGYRYFPDKVFLIASSEHIVNDIERIIGNKDYDDYAIVRIDLSGHNIGLYVDDYYNSENIVYTYESIPPAIISVVDIDEI